uniref:Uncharacterized protein n=1 Tax=Romanomermis culicivorax TaxID=13658 RepID=A0A915HUI7_ROMCU
MNLESKYYCLAVYHMELKICDNTQLVLKNFSNSCFRLYKCDVIRSKRDNAAFAKNFGGPLAAAEAPEDTSNETVGDGEEHE